MKEHLASYFCFFILFLLSSYPLSKLYQMANCTEGVSCLISKSDHFDSLNQQLLKFHLVSESGRWLLRNRRAGRKRVKKRKGGGRLPSLLGHSACGVEDGQNRMMRTVVVTCSQLTTNTTYREHQGGLVIILRKMEICFPRLS